MDENKDEEDGQKKIKKENWFSFLKVSFFWFIALYWFWCLISFIKKKPSDTEDFSFRNSKGTRIHQNTDDSHHLP